MAWVSSPERKKKKKKRGKPCSCLSSSFFTFSRFVSFLLLLPVPPVPPCLLCVSFSCRFWLTVFFWHTLKANYAETIFTESLVKIWIPKNIFQSMYRKNTSPADWNYSCKIINAFFLAKEHHYSSQRLSLSRVCSWERGGVANVYYGQSHGWQFGKGIMINIINKTDYRLINWLISWLLDRSRLVNPEW